MKYSNFTLMKYPGTLILVMIYQTDLDCDKQLGTETVEIN